MGYFIFRVEGDSKSVSISIRKGHPSCCFSVVIARRLSFIFRSLFCLIWSHLSGTLPLSSSHFACAVIKLPLSLLLSLLLLLSICWVIIIASHMCLISSKYLKSPCTVLHFIAYFYRNFKLDRSLIWTSISRSDTYRFHSTYLAKLQI